MLLVTEVARHLPLQVMVFTRLSYLSDYFFLIDASNAGQLDPKLICALTMYPVKSIRSDSFTNKQTSKQAKD